MAIREVNYFKQSKDSARFVLLTSYITKMNYDYSKVVEKSKTYSYSTTSFDKTAFPVNLRIHGQAFYNTYDQISQIFYTRPYIYEEVQSPPLPVAVRAIKDGVYVIERPPFKTSVRLSIKRAYQSKHENESPILCEIWIPWTITVLTLKNDDRPGPSMKMYYNDGPISSLDEILSPAWTPNLHGFGEMCLGETSSEFNNEVLSGNLDSNNVYEVYNYLINDYFNGGWNMDLGPGMVQNLCNRNIGLFQRDPLGNQELAARAMKSKQKIKRIDNSSRRSTLTRTNYLNWSLLTLPEVLNAVKLYKERYSNYETKIYKLDHILTSANNDINDEHEACHAVGRMMSANNPEQENWEINLKISSNVINEILYEKHSVKDLKDLNVVHFGNLCTNIAQQFIFNNQDKILPLINNALDFIANEYLQSDFKKHVDPVLVEYNDDSISTKKTKKESVSL